MYVIQALPGLTGPTYWPVEVENTPCCAIDIQTPQRLTGDPIPYRHQIGDLFIWCPVSSRRDHLVPATAYTREGHPIYGPFCIARSDWSTGRALAYKTLEDARAAIARLQELFTALPNVMPQQRIAS